MAKDRKDISDAEASFFGDDVSWLEDEEEAKAEEKKKEPERLVVAPPEPTVPVVPAAQLGRFGPAPENTPAQRRAPMPTLPPTAAMLEDALPTQTGESPVKPAAPKKAPVPVLARTLVLKPSDLAAARDEDDDDAPKKVEAKPAKAPEPLKAPEPPKSPEPVAKAPEPPKVPEPAPEPVKPPEPVPPPVAKVPDAPKAPEPAPEPPKAAEPAPEPPKAAEPEPAAPPVAEVPPEPAPAPVVEAAVEAPAVEVLPVAPVPEPPPPVVDAVLPTDLSAEDTLSPGSLFATNPGTDAPEPDLPTQEDATIDVDPPSAEVAKRRNTWDDAEPAFGDQFPESEPMVRTHDPPPGRVAEAEPSPEPAFTPPAAAPEAVEDATPVAPARDAWSPRGVEDEWREAAAQLVAEAGALEGAARGVLLAEAARIHRRRLGDRAAAEALFRDALAAGHRAAFVYQELGDAAARQQRWSEAVEHLHGRASLSEGARAAEPLQQAAVIDRQRLERPEAARAALARAVEADPEDYAAWSLYRDLLVDAPGRPGEPSADEVRVGVLARLAELGEGRIAADTWWEQGRVLQRLGRIDDARAAFVRARAAEPGHVASLLALESIELTAANEQGLAALYEDEARRPGQSDVGYWTLRAARVYAQARADDDAVRCFAQAIALGTIGARREAQGWLLRIGDFDAAERLFRDEISSTSPTGAAAAALWLAVARCAQARRDPEALRAAATAALAADADCAVAEAILSGLSRDALGQAEARAAAHAGSPAEAARLLVAAEAAGDAGNAGRAWAGLGRDADPASVDGRARAAIAAGDASGARELLRGVAAAAAVPEQARLFVRAAFAGVVSGDASALEEAAALDPTELLAVDATLEALLARGDAAGATRLALAAAEAETGAMTRIRRVRAALLAWRAGDVDATARLAQRLLAEDAADPIARELEALVAARGGAAAGLLARAVEAAKQRKGVEAVWPWLQAARLGAGSTRGDEALAEARRAAPLHPAVAFEIELGGFERGDYASLLPYWRQRAVSTTGAERTESLVRVVEIGNDLEELDAVVEAGRALAGVPAGGWPIRAVARVLESVQAWTETEAVLAVSDAAEDRIHQARILGLRLGKPAEAVALLTPLYETDSRLAAAAVAAGLAQRAGDRAAVVQANGVVAEAAASPSLRAAHAIWAAGLAEAGDKSEALRWWRLALSLRPASDVAFEGARRVAVALGDADAVVALYEGFRPEDAFGLAEALEEVEDGRAAATWAKAGDGLVASLRREIAAGRAGDWKQAYVALCARRDASRDPAVRDVLDAKRRWILAEKLATTDEAWELYRALHEEAPNDREVTEALARIAGARGEVTLSVQFLQELAAHADTPADAARYQRRVAEVYEHNGDPAGARQAFFDALDHVSDDREALAGLRRIAQATSDWAGLVAVLQREATIEQGAARVARLVDIATVTEAHLGEPRVAIDRWREVLDAEPDRVDALEHLAALALGSQEWALYVEIGRQLADRRDGAEKTALLAKIGVVALEHVALDEGVKLLEAAITETPPDPTAAMRLEQVHRGRGDWTGTVRAIGALASTVEGLDAVPHLLRAARIELEGRHDREAASIWYDRVLAITPDNEEALRFQAERLFAGESVEAALVVYERLEPFMNREGDPDDFDGRIEASTYWFRYAELLRDGGRRDESLSRYERALALNPTHLPSLEAVGPIYAERQDWVAAEKSFRQLLQLTGGHGDRDKVATLYAELGRVELALGAADKAQKRFGKALELQPNHVGALKGLAALLEQRAEWSTLLNVYNNLIYHSLVPADVTAAFLAKGKILDVQMGRVDKAAQHYESCLSVDPTHPTALLRLAELAMRRDAWDEVEKWAERGLDGRDPGPVRASFLLVKGAIAVARGGSATDWLSEACGMDATAAAEPTVDALKAAVAARA